MLKYCGYHAASSEMTFLCENLLLCFLISLGSIYENHFPPS